MCSGGALGRKTFQELFNVLCCLISIPNAELNVAPVCEELKLSTVRCISHLFSKTSLDVLDQVYTIDSLPLLGHAVTLLLSLAEREMMKKIKILAIQCLMDFMLDGRIVSDAMLLNFGNVMASFLPGISMTLARVITGDVKQGSAVTCRAINCFARVLVLVFSDAQLDAVKKIDNGDLESNEKMINSKYRDLTVKRNNEWVKETVDKLKLLIDKIAKVLYNDSWQVRLSMVKFAELLLMNCTS